MESGPNVSNIIKEEMLLIPQNSDGERQERDDRLPSCIYEIEQLKGEEACLAVFDGSCKKNPGHKDFQTLDDFKIDPMNEDDDIIEFITITADLTVRIAVQSMSTERPEFKHLANEVGNLGTGIVFGVSTVPTREGKCVCKSCQNSNTPSEQWGEVKICTANHVVYDESVVKETTCRLFYDKKDSPLVTLDGSTFESRDVEDDRCLFKCMTCDMALLEKMKGLWLKWQDQWKKLHDKYIKITDEIKTAYIVSHPHGCPKMVSVGHWIEKCENDNKTYYTYTACTCPGSSGAYVYKLGCVDFMTYHRHVHRGVNHEGLNISSIGYEMNRLVLRNTYVP